MEVSNANAISSSIDLQKRHKLFSWIMLFGAAMALFHTVEDAMYGAKESPYIDAGIALILLISYFLNVKKYHNASRIVGLSFLNLIFAVYASIVRPEIGIYLFYLPLMAISAAVFDHSQKILRSAFVALSLTLLIALFYTNFKLIDMHFTIAETPYDQNFFIANLFSSAFILIICMNFIIRLNEESETRLLNMAEQVRIKNATLEKTNQELDRFLYSTSHDLRSPLLSIKGLINIATLDTQDQKIQEYLTMMMERADRLDFFINDIIDYSRNKRTEIKIEPVNFTHLIDGVYDNFKFMANAQKIRFEKEIGLNDILFTDKGRVTVILNNLISNAIKYHNFKQDEPWIKVSIKSDTEIISITVSDNGQGIGLEHQENIFNMFYRATEQSKGSGLGLYIVKETIEKMNGSIRVESFKGKSTSFFIQLPIALSGTE